MSSIIFFGDDQYSLVVLDKLYNSGNKITSVVTLENQGNPIASFAINHDIPLTYFPAIPEVKGDEIGVLASFGKILKKDTIDLFNQNGIICLHPSLLPEYRGATPAQHAIALGDKETGITLFRLTPTVDQGEIIAKQTDHIQNSDTTPTLLTRLFTLGSEVLLKYLDNKMSDLKQANQLTTPTIFTRRFTRDTGYVEWVVIKNLIYNQPISKQETNNYLLLTRLNNTKEPLPSQILIHDLVRALTPWPGVWTIAETTKGKLRIGVEQVTPTIKVKIAGKKNSISWEDFDTYYLK